MKTIPFLLACLFVCAAHAQNPPANPPSKRQARAIEKALQVRLPDEAAYARQQREHFDQGSVVGRPIAEVIQSKGAYSRVVEDGMGGRIYAYDRDLNLRTVLYTDYHVNADGIVTRRADGTRGLGEASRNVNMTKIHDEKIAFPGRDREAIVKLVREHIKARGYALKNDFNGRIVYRDFQHFATPAECGADAYGKNRITLTIRDGEVDFLLESQLFASVFGAKLVINGNDDVASENDVPFGPYNAIAPAKYRLGFPEALYDEKGKVLNAPALEKIARFHGAYRDEIRALAAKAAPAK
jgi:hypothetical protein